LRLQMSFALSNPVSYPLITVVVVWSALLFCGRGRHRGGHAYFALGQDVWMSAAASASILRLCRCKPRAV